MTPSSDQPLRDAAATAAQFVTTHWSVVVAAGQSTSPEANQALEVLCRTYWYPLYAYVRRKGYDASDAQDLTQEFFARLLSRNYLSVADRNRGKFRSFLLGCLEHFLAREWTRAHAQKRGGGQLNELDVSELRTCPQCGANSPAMARREVALPVCSISPLMRVRTRTWLLPDKSQIANRKSQIQGSVISTTTN